MSAFPAKADPRDGSFRPIADIQRSAQSACMTDYDPNYIPDEDQAARRNGPGLKRNASRIVVGFLSALGLMVALYFYVSLALACGAPGANCPWPFNNRDFVAALRLRGTSTFHPFLPFAGAPSFTHSRDACASAFCVRVEILPEAPEHL